jgi:cell division septum initiation protein DivIVA
MEDFRKSPSRSKSTDKRVRVTGDAEAVERPGARHEPDDEVRSFPRRVMSAGERERMLDEARQLEFPVVVRGYSRVAVDRYVQRMNRLVAELEISSSPESAIRHALAQVSEEAGEVLRRARQTAEEVVAGCRAEADEERQQAEREARETLEAAHHEAKDTRDAAHREARELREMITEEARALRESVQRESTELRETTMRELAELRHAGEREVQQLRDAAQREADEVRSSSRRSADETLQRAEVRNRELSADVEAMRRECRRLVETVRLAGEHLVAIGEGRRFSRLATELLLVDDQTQELATTATSDATVTPSEPVNR